MKFEINDGCRNKLVNILNESIFRIKINNFYIY